MAQVHDIMDIEMIDCTSASTSTVSVNSIENVDITNSVNSELTVREENLLNTHSARKNISFVWKWFSKLNRDERECNICKRKFKNKAGCTSSLKRHINNQHADIICASTAAENEDSRAKVIMTMLDPNSERAKAITDGIAKMMIVDCQPFSMVNDLGFQNLIKIVEPRYVVPTRATFSNSIIPKIYDIEKKKIMEIITKDRETTQTFAFTTDGWISRANESYLSLLVHYLDKDFQIKNYTLKVSALPDSHTSENLSEWLKLSLEEWNLNNENMYIYFVTDNASNIVKAIRLTDGWERIPCFAHSLQLTIKNAIKYSEELMNVLQKCRGIVRFFHRSASATEKLKSEQKIYYLDRKPLKLIGDIETRWNSQFGMLNRLLEVRRAVNAVLCEPRMPDSILSREWSTIEIYCDILKLFKEATDILTEEKVPTLPRYMSAIYGIKRTLTDFVATDKRQRGQTIDFINHLLEEINKRFNFSEYSEAIMIAMVIDPRTKDRLLSLEEKTSARTLLVSTATKYMDVSDEINVTRNQESEPPSGSLFSFFHNISKEEENNSDSVLEEEIETYLMEKLIPQGNSILQYWKQNQARFPNLSKVARNVLAIPASQAYSERLFSMAGNIITEKRCSLLSEKVDQMCFLSANIKKSIFITN